MNLVQVHSAAGEMEASIVKGFLESAGIKSSIGPVNNAHASRYAGSTPNSLHGVYVEESNIEEAKKVLAERE